MTGEKSSRKYEEFVPYNPSYDTGYGDKFIKLDDQEVVIHETSNLPILFGAFMKLRHSKEPANPLEALYIESVKNNDNNLQTLLNELISMQPELFDELQTIYQLQEEETQIRTLTREKFSHGLIPTIEESKSGLPDETEIARRQYYYSQMFDALAGLAKEHDPAYDLAIICR